MLNKDQKLVLITHYYADGTRSFRLVVGERVSADGKTRVSDAQWHKSLQAVPRGENVRNRA